MIDETEETDESAANSGSGYQYPPTPWGASWEDEEEDQAA